MVEYYVLAKAGGDGGRGAFQLHTVSDVLTCGNGRNDEEYILVRAVDVKIVNYNMLFLLYCTYDC